MTEEELSERHEHRTDNNRAKRTKGRRKQFLVRTEAMTKEDDAPSPLAAQPLKRRSTRTMSHASKQTSMRLSMLASKSYRWNSNSTEANNSSKSSDQMMASNQSIADLAEQSVANFVKGFKRMPTRELPIAAQVVPNADDMEELIRTELEEELRSHLARELTNFRLQLDAEMIRRGGVQIADPINEMDDQQLTQYAASLQTDSDYCESISEEAEEDQDEGQPNFEPSLPPWTNNSTLVSSTRGRRITSSLRGPAAGSTTSCSTRSRTNPALRGPAGSSTSCSTRSRTNNGNPVVGSSFQHSIRQSIRMEFGDLNLDEDLELHTSNLAEARVLTTSSGREHLNNGSLEMAPEASSSGQVKRRRWMGEQLWTTTTTTIATTSSSRGISFGEALADTEKLATQHIFTTRGLLVTLFILFVVGALVGAGASILALEAAN